VSHQLHNKTATTVTFFNSSKYPIKTSLEKGQKAGGGFQDQEQHE